MQSPACSSTLHAKQLMRSGARMQRWWQKTCNGAWPCTSSWRRIGQIMHTSGGKGLWVLAGAQAPDDICPTEGCTEGCMKNFSNVAPMHGPLHAWLRHLQQGVTSTNPQSRSSVSMYEFELHAWPIKLPKLPGWHTLPPPSVNVSAEPHTAVRNCNHIAPAAAPQACRLLCRMLTFL